MSTYARSKARALLVQLHLVLLKRRSPRCGIRSSRRRRQVSTRTRASPPACTAPARPSRFTLATRVIGVATGAAAVVAGRRREARASADGLRAMRTPRRRRSRAIAEVAVTGCGKTYKESEESERIVVESVRQRLQSSRFKTKRKKKEG